MSYIPLLILMTTFLNWLHNLSERRRHIVNRNVHNDFSVHVTYYNIKI